MMSWFHSETPGYRDYRRFGHSRYTAFVLGTPIELWMLGAVVAGLLLAWLLP